MSEITASTSLEQLAALVSQALEAAGVSATLSGGAAVSLYSENEYESSDLDFVSSASIDAIADAVATLRFARVGKARQFEHPGTTWYLEFPPGPLGFGETCVAGEEIPVLQTSYGPLRIVTPTHIVMDRLAAYTHWRDGQSLDQAILVARRQKVDWAQLTDWARREGVDAAVIDRLKHAP